MKKLAIGLSLIILSGCALWQLLPTKNRIHIGFYNVENLFDTIDNPHTRDNEFTPSGKKAWTIERMNDKIAKLDQVMSQATPDGVPDLLGVCEVENSAVCMAWSKYGCLKNHVLVHRESPDHRGIDVALFYNPQKLKLINTQWYQLVQDGQKSSSTREILYASFGITKDTIHVLVNHWPSRYGGEEKSRPKRIKAAQLAKSISDSVFHQHPSAKLILMGDFNDYPDNQSLVDYLQADTLPGMPNKLYNMSYEADKSGLGSYNYRNNWGCLDQFIVSKTLLKPTRQKVQVINDSYTIVKKEFMLYTNKKGITYPSRTYGGPNYYGGYSDHLPVYITLQY